MPKFFKKLFQNLIGSFQGKYFLFHVLAVLITVVIVFLGWDQPYFDFWQKDSWQDLLFPAAMFGSLGVLFLILVLPITAMLKKNARVSRLASALAQSVILGWLISSFYKVFTGRGHPSVANFAHNLASTDFHFGFFRGGIFWGWPSGHTAVAWAAAVALFVLCSKNHWRYLALVFASYIAFGVSTNIHWLSDVVAGILIGTAIGLQVGKSYATD